MTVHRLSRWLILALAAFIVAPASLLSMGPTPVANTTQVAIGHATRLTASIPARWHALPGYGEAYGDDDGLFTSMANLAPTLGEACEEAGEALSVTTSYTTRVTSWLGRMACEVDIPRSILDQRPLTAMVLTHPEPFSVQGGQVSFVTVAADPAHFNEILVSVSFDLSAITGSQIVQSILDIAQASSFHTADVDWAVLRSAAGTVDSQGDARSFVLAHLLPALRDAGDEQATVTPAFPADLPDMRSPGLVPFGQAIGNLGYLNIPYGSRVPTTWPGYVDAGLTTTAELDNRQVCGWMIDLRGNFGGETGVMLEALTPFFPEGRILGFVDATGDETWIVRDGNDLLDDGDVVYGRAGVGPVPAITPAGAPVAILVNASTSGPGELTLISLMSRPGTRSFGRATDGDATGTTDIMLPDGSTLIFTSSVPLDRDGNTYRGPIEPDVEVPDRAPALDTASDETVIAASQWLLEQPACRDAATPVASPAP